MTSPEKCSHGGDTGESLWKCPLCLDTYRNPKLLPCSHTFCKQCLEDLVKHSTSKYSSSFSCPSCREMVNLPKGGVSAFKSNYYLEAAQPREMLCQVHTSRQRELELFCYECNTCICLQCKMEDHATHITEEVRNTAASAKIKLTSELSGLTSTIAGLKGQLKVFSAEKQAVRDKQAAVKKDIDKRHQLMVQMADKSRDDAIFSLDTATASITSQLDTELQEMEQTLDMLEKVRKRLEACIQGEAGSRLLISMQNIYHDANRQKPDLQRLLTQRIHVISRPVLHHAATADDTLTMQKQFMGSVERIDMGVNDLDVSVRHLFKCLPSGDQEQTCEVYSLFPRLDDHVWVAYETIVDSPGRCPQLLSLDGNMKSSESVLGRTNFMHSSEGTGVCLKQNTGSFQTYAKGRRLMKLKNNLDGTGVIFKVSVKSNQPLMLSSEPFFSIICGPHRAFDVHDRGDVCAVVEEAGSPKGRRKVHIYQKPKMNPVETYRPPPQLQAYQPADVCFHKIHGCHVLLVADELNDVIHVVNLDGGEMQFAGFLAAGCPLLTQPTALNIDVKGRVWVGCRSGDVLMIGPATQ